MNNRLNSSTSVSNRLSRQFSGLPTGSSKKGFGAAAAGGINIMNSSYYSDSKSVRTTGGGLANRLTFALSCVARNFKNGVGATANDNEESKEPND